MGYVGKGERYPELAAHTPADPEWLWQGYLASGSVTLLTSQWKTGKTTLLSVLLAKLPDGGELIGQKLRAGRAAVISEESRVHWRLRGERLNFGPDTRFYCRPFFGSPQPEDWQKLVDELLAIWADEGLDLVVIDTLAALLPSGAETQPESLLRVMRPLEQLTDAGIAVLLMHHPKKGLVQPGQAARGTGALTAYVDIMLEMEFFDQKQRADRRRRISAWSRFDDSTAKVLIELNDERTDYKLATDMEPELLRTLETARNLMLAVNKQLSRDLMLRMWPIVPKPALSTLWIHLERLVELGMLTRAGSGERFNPFHYSVPDRELPWDYNEAELNAEVSSDWRSLAG